MKGLVLKYVLSDKADIATYQTVKMFFCSKHFDHDGSLVSLNTNTGGLVIDKDQDQASLLSLI